MQDPVECNKNELCADVRECTPCAADFNDDRVVAVDDLMDLLGAWQKPCKLVGVFAKKTIKSRCLMRTKCFDYSVGELYTFRTVPGT